MSISLLFSILLLLLFHLRIEVGLVTTISRQVKSESKSNLLKLFNLQPANIIPISSFKSPLRVSCLRDLYLQRLIDIMDNYYG